MVEHLTGAQVRCRVVRRLVLELELYVENCSRTRVFAAVVVVVLGAPLNCTLQVSLVGFDEANNLVFLCFAMGCFIAVEGPLVWRCVLGPVWHGFETLQENSVQVSGLVSVA